MFKSAALKVYSDFSYVSTNFSTNCHGKYKGQYALITSPIPLTLEPPAHDHHLPFYFCPLNKKKHKILIDLKFQIL